MNYKELPVKCPTKKFAILLLSSQMNKKNNLKKLYYKTCIS